MARAALSRPPNSTFHAVLHADQVLVGTLGTKSRLTGRLRSLQGNSDPAPVVGDRLVCTRNNKHRGLYNGGLWTVAALKHSRYEDVHCLEVVSEDEKRGDQPNRRTIQVHRPMFEGQPERAWVSGVSCSVTELLYLDHFEFTNALTVHKAQGSQWPHVVLFDESEAFRDCSNRHVYTGLTRATESVMVVTSS